MQMGLDYTINVCRNFTFDFSNNKFKEPGFKMDKSRISLLVAANADGSDKRQFVVIHKWKKPRALKNIPVCFFFIYALTNYLSRLRTLLFIRKLNRGKLNSY